MTSSVSSSKGRLTPTSRLRMYRGSVPALTGAAAASLNLSVPGVVTVTRASEASYQTGVETDATGSFLAWAPNNTLRIQNRIPGRDAIFVEGARTNQIFYSENSLQFGTNAWQDFGGTKTAGQAAPDGGTDAVRWLTTSGAGGFGENNPRVFGANVRNAASYFIRRGSTSDNESGGNIYRSVSGRVFPADGVARNVWRRLTYNTLMNVELQSIQPVIGFPVGGPPGGIRDAIPWGMQSENGTFVSSYIRTSGATAARAVDTAMISSGNVPSWMRSGAFQFIISPECSGDEFVLHATEMTLFAWGTGTGNRIALILDAGVPKLRVVQGGVTMVTSTALAWSNWQDITITLDSARGYLVVTGANGGNDVYVGTPWTMPGGDLYVGNVSTSATPYFGEFLPSINQQQSVVLTPLTFVSGAAVVWRGDQGITLSGGAISAVADQSGGANNATQGTGSKRPLYALGGIVTDGADDQLDSTALSNFITASTFTVYLAFVPLSWTGTADLASANLNNCVLGDADAYFGISLRNVAGSEVMCWASAAGVYVGATIPATLNTPMVVCFRSEGGTLYVSSNGGTEVTASGGSVTLLTGIMRLGLGSAGGLYANARVLSMLAYKTSHTPAEIAQNVAKLRNLWNF